MRRLLNLTTAVATTLVLTAACGGSTDDNAGTNATPAPTSAAPTSTASAAPTGSAPATGAVHELRAVTGDRWSMGTLDIAVGDKVHVTNADQDKSHNAVVVGVGSSPTMNPGDEFTLTFAKAGRYQLECTFHAGMEMTVNVA